MAARQLAAVPQRLILAQQLADSAANVLGHPAARLPLFLFRYARARARARQERVREESCPSRRSFSREGRARAHTRRSSSIAPKDEREVCIRKIYLYAACITVRAGARSRTLHHGGTLRATILLLVLLLGDPLAHRKTDGSRSLSTQCTAKGFGGEALEVDRLARDSREVSIFSSVTIQVRRDADSKMNGSRVTRVC